MSVTVLPDATEQGLHPAVTDGALFEEGAEPYKATSPLMSSVWSLSVSLTRLFMIAVLD